MKIKNLLTLPLLVDAVDAFPIKGVCQFYTTKGWNKYLKQKPVKEMFVNELEKPTWESVTNMPLTSESVDSKYWRLMNAWEAAEKKVIFKPIEIIHDRMMLSHDFYISFVCESIITNRGELNKKDSISLHDLAEATNGELEIRSVML